MYNSSDDICSEESVLGLSPEFTQLRINEVSQQKVMTEVRRVTAEEEKMVEEGDMQEAGELSHHQALPDGRNIQYDPLVIPLDQGIKVRSRCSDCDTSPDANKSQNEAYEEIRAAIEVADRYEIRNEGVNRFCIPDRKREEEHEQGNMMADGSGSDFEDVDSH